MTQTPTKITMGDMAEALHRLRERNGLYYRPSEIEILREAERLIK